MNRLALLHLALALAWMVATGSATLANLLLGLVLAAAAVYLVREPLGGAESYRRLGKVVALIWLFVKELWLSALRVASIVLRPRIEISPGIIAYPLIVDRDFEIVLLANLITLTPGTLSVDVSADRRVLYIHCIDVPDPEVVIADIRDGFERRILETCR